MLDIGSNITETTKCLRLQVILIDRQSELDEHIPDHCNKAPMLLDATNCLQKYMGRRQRDIIRNIFIYA